MPKTKYSSWPSFTEKEIDAVRNVLSSNRVNYWTGSEGRRFEREFAQWCGTDYAIALANGTVAIDAALIALGVGKGDEVIVTPRTFMASVSSIVSVGATPVFVDVDRDSQNIDVNLVESAITKRSKAIIAVHLAGWPCEMDSIKSLSKEYGIAVVEDCAQAHGARYKGQSVGSFGHIGTWSFCQDKVMTTGGEGGMITTNDREYWSFIWSYKDHGKSWESVFGSFEDEGKFRWLHNSFGTNWRMTEMQAAIGRIQLDYMGDWHKKRLKNAATIWEACQSIRGLRVPTVPEYIEHAAYKCYVFVEPSELKEGWDRNRIIYEVSRCGIPCFSGSCPEVYMEKAFENTPLRPKPRLPVAKELGETSLMFLVHPTISAEELDLTCASIQLVMNQAVK